MRPNRKLSRRATAAAVGGMLAFSTGCDLDQRAQDFIASTLDSIVSSATDAFIITPINTFVQSQIDGFLAQFTPTPD